MFRDIGVTGFRGFDEFYVEGLSRVSLFVGANNAGKTTLLEAVELLALGSLRGLFRSPTRRGEAVQAPRSESGASSWETDISHLFHGHTLALGVSFSLKADGEGSWVRCEVVSPPSDEDLAQARLPALEAEPLAHSLAVKFASHSTPRGTIVQLSPDGGLSYEFRRRLVIAPPEPSPVVNYLGTELAEGTLSSLWDAVALTDEEERAIEALRIVEPRIERIAFLGEPSRRSLRNVFVKLTDSERRLPLGSAGDGLRHLLALVLHLLPARGGFLLVDEIDTGLHHSVMADMWRLVIETARRLDIQVLGTTHSLDCVRALAWVRERHPELAGEAAVHRVDLKAGRTVAYSLDEIAVAARSHLEIR